MKEETNKKTEQQEKEEQNNNPNAEAETKKLEKKVIVLPDGDKFFAVVGKITVGVIVAGATVLGISCIVKAAKDKEENDLTSAANESNNVDSNII